MDDLAGWARRKFGSARATPPKIEGLS